MIIICVFILCTQFFWSLYMMFGLWVQLEWALISGGPGWKPTGPAAQMIYRELPVLLFAASAAGEKILERKVTRSKSNHNSDWSESGPKRVWELNLSAMSICTPSESSSSSIKSWIVHGIVAGAAIAVAIGARAYLGQSKKFRSRVVGIIPARFASSRFQGKPLVNILGKPMIQVSFWLSLFDLYSKLFVFSFLNLIWTSSCKLNSISSI